MENDREGFIRRGAEGVQKASRRRCQLSRDLEEGKELPRRYPERKCRGPEAGACLVCSRDSKEAYEAGAEGEWRKRGKVGSEGYKGARLFGII